MNILLSNDDGLDSPALIPTIKMLSLIGTVQTVVPRYQQSWTSKANTRRSAPIPLERHEIGGYKVLSLDALPADCSNFGIYDGEKPDLVVSGANVGHNLGLSAMFSSGTIGAALEGLFAGIPSIAISVPYTPQSMLISDNFTNTLVGLERVIQAFYDNRPYNVGLAMLNLPIGLIKKNLKATSIADYHYGSLFDNHDTHVVPKHYYKLDYPPTDRIEFGTDLWARSQGMASLSFMEFNGKLVDTQITKGWVEDNKLMVVG